mgnify:FL=1
MHAATKGAHQAAGFRDVWKYEGPSALFKGLGPTLVGVVPGRCVAMPRSPLAGVSAPSACRR